MKKVVRMDYIYITDNLIIKMGLVTRCELEDGSIRWYTTHLHIIAKYLPKK